MIFEEMTSLRSTDSEQNQQTDRNARTRLKIREIQSVVREFIWKWINLKQKLDQFREDINYNPFLANQKA